MKHRIFFLFVMLCLCLPAAAQSGWGGRGSAGGGLFAEANAASQGRSITVGGRLLPIRKISHNFIINGYVEEILVEVGDKVSVGQALVKIKRDAVGETFLPVILESRSKGTVSEIHIVETEQVTSGSPAVTIIDNSAFILHASVSDRDAEAVRRLGKLEINALTPDGGAFIGKLVRVSQEPDYSTGLFSITIEFKKQQGLFLGMLLFIDLPVEKAAGIAVEKAALLTDDNKTHIWILNGDNVLSLRPVITAAEIDGKITIESGIAAGERYLTRLSGSEEEGMLLKELLRKNMNSSPASGGE